MSQTERHDTDAALMQVPAGYLAPPRRLGLVAKMSLTLLLILGFALGLSALLNYFNFEKGYAQLLRSRHAIVLEDMAHRIEYGLGLGLGLSSMDNVPLLLREARREQPDLTRLQVFDDRGRVIVDAEGPRGAEEAAATTAVPDSWREMARAAEGRWSTASDAEYLLGRTLFNSYGQREGALVLGFSRESVAGPVRELGWRLLRQATITLALFGLLGWLLVRLASGRLLRTLRGMEQAVAADLADEPHPAASEASTDPLERDCAAFRASLRRGLNREAPRRGGGV